MEESKFYDILRNTNNINLSKQFLDLFHILINAKKSAEMININDQKKTKSLQRKKPNKTYYHQPNDEPQI